MLFGLDIPSVSAIIAAIGVLVGVLLTVLELRNLVRQRQTDLVMRVYSTYGTREFRDALVETCNLQFKDYEDFERKYGPWFSKGPAQMAVFIVGWYFEGIGALLQENLIDISFIYSLLSGPIKVYWEKMEPLVLGLRKQLAQGFLSILKTSTRR